MLSETKKRKLFPRSQNQTKYFEFLNNKSIVFAIGPAGTGKTFLAVARAVSYLQQDVVKKIILSRPAVEAGEKLGFLPGDLKEKVDPFLKPIYDALYAMIPYDQVEKKINNGIIEMHAIHNQKSLLLESPANFYGFFQLFVFSKAYGHLLQNWLPGFAHILYVEFLTVG